MTVPAGGRRLCLPGNIFRAADLVSGMAIDADRSFCISGLQSFAMNPGKIFSLGSRMAGTAGVGNVGTVSTALRIFVAEDFVRSMATDAGGGHQKTALVQGKSMNRIHVALVYICQAVLLGKI